MNGFWEGGLGAFGIGGFGDLAWGVSELGD